jgi:hypothetical protein
MIKKTIKITLILFTVNLYSQSQVQKDSIVTEICKTIKVDKHLNDSIRIENSYLKHLYPYLNKFPENERENIGISIYYRLQKNCKDFLEILDRNNPAKGDWKVLDKKPKILIDKLTSQSLKNFSKFRYFESANGDIIQVILKNGFWTEYFLDSTYSKLKFNWIDDFKFEIEFIESNNESRKNFSKIGDKYIYEIFNKKDNYFELLIEYPNSDKYLTFKIYID